MKCPKLMAILRSTEEVKSKVDDKKELQPPDGSSEGDEILKVAEQNDETADPKITVELQKSKGQDESNSSGENSHSDSTSDDEQQSMSKLQLH